VRILVFTQYFWPETFGINDLVSKLIDAGLRITVLTGKPNYPDGKIFDGYSASGIRNERFGEAEIVRVPLFPRGRNSRIRLALNYLSFILSGLFIAPYLLRGKRFDAIFVYAPSPILQALPAVLMAVLKRAPLIVWVQDLWPASLAATGHVRNRWWLYLLGTAVRFIYRYADIVAIQSEGFREPVSRLLDDPSKIHYLPNSVNLGTPPSPPELPALTELIRCISDCFSVVFTGNMGNAQSLETVVAAADLLSSHSDIRFFLVGSGSRLDWLTTEISRRQLTNIVLPGRFAPTAMSPIFAASSVLLATLGPETVFTFTIPSKLQSYLASRRPIIISADGEAASVIAEARAGLVCKAGNAEGLATTILHMRAISPTERDKFGENGRRYAKAHYDLDQKTEQLIALLDSAIKANRGSPT
jgi:glycosyltransferase involved in cell wall biosynthesis